MPNIRRVANYCLIKNGWRVVQKIAALNASKIVRRQPFQQRRLEHLGIDLGPQKRQVVPGLFLY